VLNVSVGDFLKKVPHTLQKLSDKLFFVPCAPKKSPAEGTRVPSASCFQEEKNPDGSQKAVGSMGCRGNPCFIFLHRLAKPNAAFFVK